LLSGGFTKRTSRWGRIAYWYDPNGLNKDVTTGYRLSDIYAPNINNMGYIYIFGLPEGTYKFVETQAPAGYELPNTPVEVEFEITIVLTDASAENDISLIIPENINSPWDVRSPKTNGVLDYKYVSLTNTPKSAPEIKVLKVGVPANNLSASGTQMANIGFKLVKTSNFDNNWGAVPEKLTGSDGYAIWSSANIETIAAPDNFAGTYMLVESTPPNGITPIDPIMFSINGDGQVINVQLGSNNPQLVSFNNLTNSVEFKVKNTVAPGFGFEFVKFEKHGEHISNKQGKPLAGAEFTLYSAVATVNNTVTVNESTAITSVISDANGTVKFNGLEPGTYYMKETVVPNGYDPLNLCIYKIVIGNDGTYVITVSLGSSFDNTFYPHSYFAAVLTVNELTGGVNESGKDFGIYSDAACTVRLSTATSGADGKLLIGGGDGASKTYYVKADAGDQSIYKFDLKQTYAQQGKYDVTKLGSPDVKFISDAMMTYGVENLPVETTVTDITDTDALSDAIYIGATGNVLSVRSNAGPIESVIVYDLSSRIVHQAAGLNINYYSHHLPSDKAVYLVKVVTGKQTVTKKIIVK